MAWTNYQYFLAALMVITGSINTLSTKWADKSESKGKDGTIRKFDHPFLQASGMFIGEFSCMIVYYITIAIYKRKNGDMAEMKANLPASVAGNSNFNPLIFLPPAMCDMLGTSIMYVGLGLTYASSFQMLRGAVIIFTGLLSVAFLGRKLKLYEWLGIVGVVLGLLVVGSADLFFNTSSKSDTNSILTGDLLIIIAQIIAGTQMVVEEKFVSSRNVPPLLAVGWEGFFGFIVISVLLIPMYYIPVGRTLFHNPDGNLEDVIDGFYQIANNWEVCFAFMGTIVSIAFFNFAGISVTKELSATTRMVLDSVRTIVIWIFTISIKWQRFQWLQLLGFFVLIVGMCLYNDVLIYPILRKYGFCGGNQPDLQPIMEDAYEPNIATVSTENKKNAESNEHSNVVV